MKAMHVRRPKIQGEKFLGFRCTECGNCCSDTLVPITDEDVRRLMKGTGLPAQDICTFYKSEDFEDKGEGLEFANLDGGRKTLGLRKKFDKDNDRDSCKFFKDNRCSVYESRPVTCRVWPFTLAFDSTGKRVTKLSINDALPCPYELDGKNTVSELTATWNWDDRQDGAWSKKVRQWNTDRTAGSEEEFLKFLGLM
jgi:Fe-S-cluster containining protein